MSCAYKFNVESDQFGIGIVSEHWGLVVESDCVIDASDIKNEVRMLLIVGSDGGSAFGFRTALYGELSRPTLWGETIDGFIANNATDKCQLWFDPIVPVPGISSPQMKYPAYSDQWLTYDTVSGGYERTDAALADFFTASNGGTIDVYFRSNA